jgi:hypothetical protein
MLLVVVMSSMELDLYGASELPYIAWMPRVTASWTYISLPTHVSRSRERTRQPTGVRVAPLLSDRRNHAYGRHCAIDRFR